MLASGGGGGGYATSGSKGSGGSAGNICCVKVNVTPGTVYNVAVGAGGAAGKNASNSGTGSATQPQNGGDSSFGNVVCIGGGCGANSNGNPTANSEQAIGARIGFNGCVLFIIAGNTGSRGNSGDGVGGTASVTSKYYYGFTGAAGGAGLSYGYGSNGESGKVAIIW